MLKQKLQNLKIVNTIKNNTVARGNNLKTRMFDNLSFTEIFETFDEEYLTYVAYENHNLFGMKEARVRLNLAGGTQYGHAYYKNWEESVMDYALWYSTYAYKCKTEKQLFKLLDKQYAEAPAYVSSLQHIIKINNLKEKFE